MKTASELEHTSHSPEFVGLIICSVLGLFSSSFLHKIIRVSSIRSLEQMHLYVYEVKEQIIQAMVLRAKQAHDERSGN